MSITTAKAIRSLDTDSRFSIRDGVINWETDSIDQVAIDAEIARLQAEYDSKAYARARADAYAPIGDQLDMQYHDSVNGSRTWLDHIEAVKEALSLIHI